jgi:hypothetical protein
MVSPRLDSRGDRLVAYLINSLHSSRQGTTPISERFKPAASIRSRLLVAASIWTLVGTGLFAAGVNWTVVGQGARGWAGLALALLLGWLKAHYLLSGRAAANAHRIVAAGEGRCLGGVFEWSAWWFVLAMVGLGYVLRHSDVPRPWIGVIYAAVGSALVLASVSTWRHWRALGRSR